MTYEEFLVHFNFPVTPKEFSLVFSEINYCIVSLFRDVKLVDMPIVNLTDTICGKICFSQTKNNKSIRSLFLRRLLLSLALYLIGLNVLESLSGKVFGYYLIRFLLQTR